MAGFRSHDKIVAWQRANELKLLVYALLKHGSAASDYAYCDQLRRSAAAAPRLIAEGFGRYLPGDFSRYLRLANAELHETSESLRDGVARRHFTNDEIAPLLRLARRASKAASNLIAYLRTANAPHEAPRRTR